MGATKPIYPALSHRVAGIYGFLVLITIPWTVYIGLTLPTRHLSRHWDAAWVGLDIAIIVMLILNAVYSYFESKWLVVSTTATTTLLLVDGWFDVMSAHSGKAFAEALALALLIELPLAVLSFSVTLKLVNREHLETK